MRRGNRQRQLDNFLLRVFNQFPKTAGKGWFSLDITNDYAVKLSEEEPADFDAWFARKSSTRARYIRVFRSLERLVELGLVEKRRSTRASFLNMLQYRKLSLLDVLARGLPKKEK
jgi:hypothetical protein